MIHKAIIRAIRAWNAECRLDEMAQYIVRKNMRDPEWRRARLERLAAHVKNGVPDREIARLDRDYLIKHTRIATAQDHAALRTLIDANMHNAKWRQDRLVRLAGYSRAGISNDERILRELDALRPGQNSTRVVRPRRVVKRAA